ncbi:DUF1444 domain-containing protein [Caldibacillus lycopersici]|uniref:UPF0354 protein OEV98_11785 n=1 Tax=Perspicuibacillus lycopersici TaxID=1325689 RepID=A0AAE3ITS0_9BACI|nr:DUF1444 domain-containing protein [Perspicuibacillus lycopersici]MCU9614242.1 DUF1444 domain-containing protein [Perspicuibacillus lycopersici]
MKMTVTKLRKLLEERLEQDDRNLVFDREKESLRIEDKQSKKGLTVSLPPVIAKWENQKDAAIEEVIYYVEEALKAMNGTQTLAGKENKIFPVIRSTSFPKKTEAGGKLLIDEHTAETRIYYAVDLGNTFRLIDEKMLEKEKWDAQEIREMARFNVRSLPCPLKKDTVSENDFYFLNTNDGYDASRILNESFLNEMKEKVEGTLAISIPHQDVLIFADVKNQTGYDILAQMSMSFFTNGHVPITSLSFYYENGKLEPIFILAKNRPSRKE